MYEHLLTTVDTHTAGEPTRIVVSGVPFLKGTMAERRRQLQEAHDDIRTTLMHEPRGHGDMFGAILMAPADPDADLGVVFMDSGGYLAMCGHGSIGAVTAALTTGVVAREEPKTCLAMDTPAGIVRARARVERGRVREVSVENVPSFLQQRDVELDVPSLGTLRVDIAFGGNFFALVPAEILGLAVELADLPDLIERGLTIRAAVNAQINVVHPTNPEIDTVELVEIYQEHPEEDVDCSNVVVFGQGQVDRSPCGTGTSAKMAALHAKGRLDLKDPFVNESIIGTRFTGRLLREEQIGELTAVVPEITGSAYVTGFHQFVVESDDPLGSGFHLDTSGA